MIKLLKSELYKLFYCMDHLGFMIVGSILAIACGCVMAIYYIPGLTDVIDMNFVMTTVRFSYFGILICILVLQSFFTCKAFSNKTFYYEVMEGYKTENILFSRWVISLLVAFVLSVVIVIYVCSFGMVKDFSNQMKISSIIVRGILSFIVILHIAMVTEMYLMAVRNAMTGIGVGFLIQYVFMAQILNSKLLNLEEKGERYAKITGWLSVNQFNGIWQFDIDTSLYTKILLSFAVEVVIMFILVNFFYKRYEWK